MVSTRIGVSALAFVLALWLRTDMLETAVAIDIPAIVDLVNHAYRGTGESRSWNVEDFIVGPRIDATAVRDDIEEDGVHLLIHRDVDNGRPIATVFLSPIEGDAWYLGMLSVAPGLQDRRLGRLIIRAAEDFVLREGGRSIRLSVVSRRETLIQWYIRRGYRLTGETAPFPYGDDRLGRPLRDDLQFVILEKAI